MHYRWPLQTSHTFPSKAEKTTAPFLRRNRFLILLPDPFKRTTQVSDQSPLTAHTENIKMFIKTFNRNYCKEANYLYNFLFFNHKSNWIASSTLRVTSTRKYFKVQQFITRTGHNRSGIISNLYRFTQRKQTLASLSHSLCIFFFNPSV